MLGDLVQDNSNQEKQLWMSFERGMAGSRGVARGSGIHGGNVVSHVTSLHHEFFQEVTVVWWLCNLATALLNLLEALAKFPKEKEWSSKFGKPPKPEEDNTSTHL